MSDQPTILVVATYASEADAQADYEALLASHKDGDLGHLAAGIVDRDVDGKLHLHRHDTTTKHLALGGTALGAALVILAPPVGVSMLGAATVTAGGLAGAGALVGHYWHNIPKAELRELGDLLEGTEAALVAIAVDKQEAEIDKTLAKAEKKVLKKLEKGDLEAAYDAAVAGVTKAEMVAAR